MCGDGDALVRSILVGGVVCIAGVATLWSWSVGVGVRVRVTLAVAGSIIAGRIGVTVVGAILPCSVTVANP